MRCSWEKGQERTMVASGNGKIIQQSTVRKLGRFVVVLFLYRIDGETHFSTARVHAEKIVECNRLLEGIKQLVYCCVMCTARLHFRDRWLLIEFEHAKNWGSVLMHFLIVWPAHLYSEIDTSVEKLKAPISARIF
jgi:hypothetical protein